MPPLTRSTPDLRTYSVPRFLKTTVRPIPPPSPPIPDARWEKYGSVRAWGPQTPIVRLAEIATLDEQEGCWRLDPA